MPNEICSEICACRICGSSELAPVIDLGDQYLANHFVGDRIPRFMWERYPLQVIRCAEPKGCGLVQIRHSVAPSALYFNYGYLSGINESMRSNLRDIATNTERMAELQPGDTVLDIGCNDGTLLSSYQASGLDRLGIDPAANAVKLAREQGLEVVNDFFSQSSFETARPGGKARAVTSIAMFYDLERPMEFVSGVGSVLADDGVWVIELSYLPFMLRRGSFDTICHEHLEYYALRQIEWMLSRHGMAVHRIELNDVNGGSFRVFIRKDGVGTAAPEDRAYVDRLREEETSMELDSDAPYAAFRESASRIRSELSALLKKLTTDGKKVYVYGASTKGNTILQYCGIDHNVIPYAADRNQEKWGRRTLGTDIPIISEEQARAQRPDYFLVLPWHFMTGFLERERAFLDRGGKFIVPLPQVRVIGKEDL